MTPGSGDSASTPAGRDTPADGQSADAARRSAEAAEAPVSQPGGPGDLFPRVYQELRQMAGQFLSGRRPGDSLSTTVLVHEAYLRLFKQGDEAYVTRGRFFGTAARAMRSILVDHARRRGAAKRGGGRKNVPLDQGLLVREETDADLVALDEALTRLAETNARRAQIVELRFFAGLTVEEVAEVLETSPATVKREWALAKVWLRRALTEE